LGEETGVLLAPPLNYGMSLHHLGFPGTLSLRPKTLSLIVTDLLESAFGHGFRRILLLNGHGGNVAAIQVALAELLHALPSLQVHLGNWWREPEVGKVLEAALPGGGPQHADAGETSLVLAIRPDVVRLDRAKHSPDVPDYGLLTRQVFAEHFPHGVIGADPQLASAELGERVLRAAISVYRRILEAWSAGARSSGR
jgi:creatinine amidohydrolase